MTNILISKKEEDAIKHLTEQSDAWVSVGEHAKRKAFWKNVATRAIEGKRKRISISLNEDDLARLRSEAVRTGIPYQTIIGHLIRRHVRAD